MKNLDFKTFSKQELDNQFLNIENISSSLSHIEIQKQISTILFNRAMSILIFNENTPEFEVFRVTQKYDGFDPNKIEGYSYNKNPSQQRANIKDNPVLYVSSSPINSILEMKNKLGLNEHFYISKWKIKFNKKTNIHSLLYNTKTINKDHSLNYIVNYQYKNLKEIAKNTNSETYTYAIQKMGDLFCKPTDKFYHITSAYSHHILYENKNTMNVPIILYPAVESDQNGINWAIHPDFVESTSMKMKEVYEVTLTSKNDLEIGINIFRKGILQSNNSISWKDVIIKIINVNYLDLEIITYDEQIFKGKEALNKKLFNKNIDVKKWLKTELYSNEFYDKLAHYPSQTKSKIPLSFNNETFEYLILSELNHGVEIITEKSISCIKWFVIPIKWVKKYN
jgi:hypothetical protein